MLRVVAGPADLGRQWNAGVHADSEVQLNTSAEALPSALDHDSRRQCYVQSFSGFTFLSMLEALRRFVSLFFADGADGCCAAQQDTFGLWRPVA